MKNILYHFFGWLGITILVLGILLVTFGFLLFLHDIVGMIYKLEVLKLLVGFVVLGSIIKGGLYVEDWQFKRGPVFKK